MNGISPAVPSKVVDPDPGIYKRGSYIVLDFETTNTDKGDALNPDNQIVLAYWILVDEEGNERHRYCFAEDIAQSRLVEDIKSVDFIVAHNSKFELQWLYRCGVDLRDVLVYDTMVAEYVIGGNKKISLRLGQVAKRYGLGSKEGLVDRLITVGVCPSTIKRKWVLRYGRQDVVLTKNLFEAQLKWIDEHFPRLLPVVYTRCLLTPVLADIEKNGMTLDKDKVNETRNDHLTKLAEVEEALHDINPDINWNSTQQRADFLYGELGFKELVDRRGDPIRTPAGNPKTDVDTMLALKSDNEVQEKVIKLIRERNKYATALSKSLDFFYGICEEYGGVYRGVFNQCVTATHRLSSSGKRLTFDKLGKEAGAQLQNLPREFKSLHRASGKDRVLGEIDGSQLEFRVAGHLGRDKQVLHDILHGVDIHEFTARSLTEAGEPTSRQDAKASTFKPLYGGSSGSKALQEYFKAFREKYRDLADTQASWVREAAATKRVETEWGMVYYFPHANVSRSGYVEGTTQIYNFPVQAFATAEIIPIALVILWHMLRDTGITIINTVHDSIIVDMPVEGVKTFAELGTAAMLGYARDYLNKCYSVDLIVPLGVGIKVGTRWNIEDEEYIDDILLGIKEAGYEGAEDDGEVKAEEQL